MKKILIPSKGRAGKSELLQQLNNDSANCMIFVEPQDFQQYMGFYPNLAVHSIGQNNRGLPFVRNEIAGFAEEAKLDKYWLLDDDIKFFEVTEDGKMLPTDYRCLEQCEGIIGNDYAQASLEYRQFAWSNPRKIHEGTYCHCAVLMNVEQVTGLRCDETLDLKIDQDLTIQILSKGLKTARICHYAIGSPKNGSNGGGLKAVYHKEEENCLKMVQKWGERICHKIVKDDGRHDIKILWRNIGSKQTELF